MKGGTHRQASTPAEGKSVTVAYHADLTQVESVPEWADFLSDAVQLAPFDRLAWWQNLASSCAVKPFIAIAQAHNSPQGRALAVLPLARAEPSKSGTHAHPRDFTALANWYTFRCKPLLSRDNPAAAQAALDAIAHDLKSKADRITFAPVPNEEREAERIIQSFRQAGWLVFASACDRNHILPVHDSDFAAYHARLPARLRTTLKRKSGKVIVKICKKYHEDDIQSYEDIYQDSWKPEEGSPRFWRRFVEEEARAGRLRMALAYAAPPSDGNAPCENVPLGPAIAAQIWTVEGGCAFIHKLAHRESAKALSPGSVLTAALMRHVMEEDRVQLVDFGTGDDGYKRDWMQDVRMRYRLEILRPSAPRNWGQIVKLAAKSAGAALAGGGKHG